MKKILRNIILGSLFMLITALSFGQTDKKIWISGSARGILMTDKIDVNDIQEDTLTARRINSGHSLADLDVNIRPNKNIFITSTLRVRNDHGGFWGSGTSFDLRQLYMKGLIANAIRFQIGDINYKLTDYTFINNNTLADRYQNDAFSVMQSFIDQDLFYTDDLTWRQQGLAVDFGLVFKKVVDELNFDFFTFRLNPTNFGSSDDEFISGGISTLKISDFISMEGAFSSTYEVEGTGTNSDFFRNNVGSGSLILNAKIKDWNLRAKGTMGTSLWEKQIARENKMIEDYFADAVLTANRADGFLSFELGYRNVGPNYRSVGAQSQRINFNTQPNAYSVYGNDKNQRMISWFDLLRDATVYNYQLSDDLQSYNPQYGNISPYGRATPNRTILNVNVGVNDKNEMYKVNADLEFGGEVIGQGTESKREFISVGISADLNIDKITKLRNSTTVNLSYWNENTSRTAESEFAVLDFNNSLISASVVSNVWESLDLIAGFQMLKSSGNELINRRDDMGEIIGYNELKLDASEDILGLGVQYRFNEFSKLRVLYTDYGNERGTEGFIPYSISNVSMMFQIVF